MSFHSLCCFINRKVESLKQTEHCVVSKVQQVFEVQSFGFNAGPIIVPLIYCPPC